MHEVPIVAEQEIAGVDENNVGLTGTAPDTLELRIWLRYFGDELLVVRPAGLRHDLRKMAVNLREDYAARRALRSFHSEGWLQLLDVFPAKRAVKRGTALVFLVYDYL